MLAAIDIGTNSTRLLIGSVEDHAVSTKYTGLRTTRLGEGLKTSKEIKPEAIERTIDALKEYRQIIRKMRVEKIDIVATSAARDAENSELLVEKVYEHFGWDLRIISGEEEAGLSYEGATSAVKTSPMVVPVVVDIGGGSTELVFSRHDRLHSYSINVGAVRCTEVHTTPTEMEQLLQPALAPVKELSSVQLIGVGGTITSLAAIDLELVAYDPKRVQGYPLRRDTVAEILFKLAGMSIAQRKKVPGLSTGRADIIIAGTTIVWVIMTSLNINKLTVSEADLLHGMLLQINSLYR